MLRGGGVRGGFWGGGGVSQVNAALSAIGSYTVANRDRVGH